ncbi:phage tail tape measure protein [Cryobacterium sp. PH31-AA6]|uniref:phage tail tape measure protein n=1 Tax=Cryobacterium sp. PH31-AA6 TaxID=3046205 RepID=UPI0024B9B9BC|nr:phage tail tape measure protein [Cryobacterium sp. PH31-AA6]MDJ0323165.1 phage tail tape measure protein [Cryobacterium sp. PH31-AA6]
MSAAFNAGAIAFRIQTVGAEVFKRDLTDADRAVAGLGASADTAAKKIAPVGEQVDKTGKAAKAAKAPVEDAGKATKKLGEEADTAAPKVKKTAAEIEDLKKKSDDAGRLIGTAAVGIGAAIAAMAAVSVAKFSEFAQANSNTAAATMANAATQKQLGAAAIKAGADSAYSATEAANAQTELSKAGLTTSAILGGALNGSLALAAAGELGVARAAEIAATTLSVFKLKGSEAGHVADLLAAGAGKAQGSVDDLALALNYVGPTFARLKIPLEETVGTLGLLAANGILGEKAGTGLRGVIQSLTSPMKKGADVMEEYGIKVFDAQGNFIGMGAAAEQLKKGLGGLNEETRSAALGAIFGAESANAAGTLYEAGAKGVAEWTANVNDAGYAALQAAKKQDNLAGDIEKLGGAMDSALINTGSAANGSLREMVQIVTGLVDVYGSLDPAVQGTALALGVGTAAALLLGGTMLLMVPKIAQFKIALLELNTTMKKTAVAGGAIGLALTALVVVLGLVGSANADAQAKTSAYGDTLEATTGRITDSTRDMIKANLQIKGSFLGIQTGADSAYDAAQKIGLGLDVITNAASGSVPDLKLVQQKLAEIQGMTGTQKEAAFGKDWVLAAASAQRVSDAVKGESDSLAEAIRLAEQKQSVDGETVDSSGEVAAAYDVTAAAVDGVSSSLADLADSIDAANGKNLDARASARKLEEAYDSFDQSLKDNGTTLDITTEKGRNNQAALDDIAQAAMDSGQAVIDAGGGYAEYQASLEASRDSLMTRITDLGVTGQAASDLADEILKIPSKAEFEAIAKTDAATAKVQAFLGLLASVPASKQTSIGITVPNALDPYRLADGGVMEYFANGGTRENHVAQIARAGSMRVWAEPETGGEAYIPLTPAKRGRSTEILADVAGKFGYQLVPVGAQSYAGGGVNGGTAGGATWTGDVNVTTPPNEDPRILARGLARELVTNLAGMK